MGLRWDTLAWGSWFTQRQRSTVNGRATLIPTSLVGRFPSCHGKGYSTPDFTIFCNFGGQEGGGWAGRRPTSVLGEALGVRSLCGEWSRQAAGPLPRSVGTHNEGQDRCLYVRLNPRTQCQDHAPQQGGLRGVQGGMLSFLANIPRPVHDWAQPAR